ncbi:MAG TPA: hypothetical protein PKO35_02725 [Candidatus Atribacteria bacterium]|nr:hypothetical protein [Candidatus Atribacteria bacterium]
MDRKSKTVALGGIFGALNLLTLFCAAYVQTNTLFFYGASSLFVSFVIVEAGIGAGWLFYGAMTLLAFLLLPDKPAVLPYAVFFGLYGLVKYYTESLKRPVPEYILKGAFLALAAAALYLLYTRLFARVIVSVIPLQYLILPAILVFYIYDYLYTRFLSFYIHKFVRKA